jgi:hypothetical protein
MVRGSHRRARCLEEHKRTRWLKASHGGQDGSRLQKRTRWLEAKQEGKMFRGEQEDKIVGGLTIGTRWLEAAQEDKMVRGSTGGQDV